MTCLQEAALKLADKWDESAARFRATSGLHSDPVKKSRNLGIAQACSAHAQELREALTEAGCHEQE
jgi:hypothetical protein